MSMENGWQLLYWGTMLVATLAAYRYFRDLGDITQALLKVTRRNMVFAIRHEHLLIAISLIGISVAALCDYVYESGAGPSTAILVSANLFFIGIPYIWLHVGLRNQQYKATYYSIEEAAKFVRPSDSVIVIENNGEARAHPDYHIKRPHLAGTVDGLGGENVIMTYCCMTHLGLGFKPEIDSKPQNLTVIAQIGNNLIMRDAERGEPIQQMYGTRECDGRFSEHAMPQWPTCRMTFRAFQKAYPDGTVFLNKIPPFRQNPLLYLLDHIVEGIMLWGTVPHHTNESLLFDTMDVYDDRLPLKELVWGFNVGRDSIAYTEDYVRATEGPINVQVGGRDIVIAWDDEYESLGIYYNDTGGSVTSVDFWGRAGNEQLQRVETVKAGAYWCVWANYFPETDLNQNAGTELLLAS
jgi:hypothetical protein